LDPDPVYQVITDLDPDVTFRVILDPDLFGSEFSYRNLSGSGLNLIIFIEYG
jgi:hypothetical protein